MSCHAVADDVCPPRAVSACCFDRDPKSDGYAAKPHGRIDFLMQLCRLLVVFVYEFDDKHRAALLLVVLCCCVGLSCYGLLVYQPYYKSVVNRLCTAGWFGIGWACLCAVLLQLRGRPEVSVPLCVLLCGAVGEWLQ